MRQKLELASELEFDPRDTVDWCKMWLVDFNAGKTELVSFQQLNNNGCIRCENGSVCSCPKIIFKMLGLTFSSKLE